MDGATLYFDETIFTNGYAFQGYEVTNTFNEVDRFLVQRLGLSGAGGPHTEPVNLNPPVPQRGINIYTMDPRYKNIRKMEPVNPVGVVASSPQAVPLSIEEPQDGAVYDVGLLGAFESALLIKYYAIKQPGVMITEHLYEYIVDYFDVPGSPGLGIDGGREWFMRNAYFGLHQNRLGELIDERGNIAHKPYLGYSSTELSLQ